MVVTVWEYTPGDVFLSMLWFFLFFIWIWLLISVFADIFRSDDLGGWGKALWTVFVIVLPYLGVFVYLIARGRKMGEHAARHAAQQEAQFRAYVQSVATPTGTNGANGSGGSGGEGAVGQIQRLAELRDSGALTDEEFQAAKARVLA